MYNKHRLVSLDAYRGFVMLVMASGGLGIASAVEKHGEALSGPLDKPAAYVWFNLAHHLQHRDWVGCSFWDLIQPSFMFMVGVAIPFSYLSRYNEGHTKFDRFLHVVGRSLILILLGVFLQSQSSEIANFTFVNVLTQIGLGYPIVYLLMRAGQKTHLFLICIILFGYGAFFHYAPPNAEQDTQDTRAFLAANPNNWDAEKTNTEQFSGKLAVWNKHINASGRFDRWLLNLFPRNESAWPETAENGANETSDDSTEPAEETNEAGEQSAIAARSFWANRGGYQTLNFVPSIVTMLFGLMAGRILLTDEIRSGRKLWWLIKASALCFLISMAVDTKIWPVEVAGMDWSLCPTIKKIWTPTWTVFSAGWAFLLMAAFFLLLDILPLGFLGFPLVVVGMNSIVMYVMHQLIGRNGQGWLLDKFKMVLRTIDASVPPQTLKNIFGADQTFMGFLFGADQPLAGPIAGLCSLGLMWLICLWLYRRRLFVRI